MDPGTHVPESMVVSLSIAECRVPERGLGGDTDLWAGVSVLCVAVKGEGAVLVVETQGLSSL